MASPFERLPRMGIKQYAKQSRVLDGPMDLGVGNIVEATFLMDGSPIQSGFMLDAVGGKISRDVPSNESAIFTFTFDYDDFTIDEQWAEVRSTRNNLLYDTDWTQNTDNKLTGQAKQDMKDYRQTLRDVTDDFNDPGDVIFPVPPPS